MLKSVLQTILITLIALVFNQCSPASQQTLEIRHRTGINTDQPTIVQSERAVPVVGTADVVIAGGGIAGVAAALRAAEEGRSVILVETRNYLGQELTATYRNEITEAHPPASLTIAGKIYRDLADENIYSEETFNPSALKNQLHQIVDAEKNIRVFLYSLASGVVINRNRVQGVVFSDFNGRHAVLGKIVIDATEDARISAAAGASFRRNLGGEITARRVIAARLPGSLSTGSLAVDEDLGLSGNEINIRPGYFELTLDGQIGDDVGADLSAIQAATLDKAYALRDHMMQEGIVLGNFSPAPETWIDEMPVVECRDRFTDNELKSLDLANADALLPRGLDGILIAGRTVDTDPAIGSLQALLCVGELAGKKAAAMATEGDDLPELPFATSEELEREGPMHVRELLSGIEPDQEYQWIRQSAVELPVSQEFDVLVVGGGTSGAFAAISAAREGAHVAIVEILPNLGGISSNRVTGYYWGVPWKSFLRQEVGDRIHLRRSTGQTGPLEKVGFSGEDKKYTLQDLAQRANVRIYYQSLAAGVVVSDNKVEGVVVENATGRHVLLADVIIDATGQGGIAAAAGAKFAKGRETDGLTLEIEHGPLRDPTHTEDISAYYMKHPSQAISLNIRESRRIIGDHTVTFEDAIHEKIYPDMVGRFRSNYDTHFPSSANQSDLGQDWTAILGLWRRPVLGSISYGSILPKGMDNILVASNGYSIDHDALIAGRMQPDLEHLGEVAGIAAASAASNGLSPREIPVKELQKELIRRGILRSQDLPDLKVSDPPSLDELHRQDYWRAEREAAFPPSEDLRNKPLEEAVLTLGTERALDGMTRLYLAGKDAIPLLRPLVEPAGKRMDVEVIPELKPLIDKRNPRVREEAAILLGLLGDESAVPVLREFLRERNSRQFEYKIPLASSRPSVPLYWSSAILLGRFQEKEAVPDMLDLLSLSPSPEALDTMRRSYYGDVMFDGSDLCPPPLTSFLIVALGRIGDPRAVEAIRPYLEVKASDPVGIRDENTNFEIDWGIRTNAAWSLARMGDQSGVPILIELLEADQVQVRNYAQMLLERITGEQLGRDPESWSAWWQQNKPA